ncbi:MAG: S-layer homology domain-containing protein [Scytonematopsis contorta HA4267-MV1]|nr:S-layer homology domain-containing protein [Scytonematopsis contorta HA4267-MV1]
MSRFLRFLSLFATLPVLSFVVHGITPSISKAQAPTQTQTSFPDVPSNYWAQPFIQRLAQREILAGYPDGTFRPEQTMQRDELAAVIRKAFNQPVVQQIESGSVYKDVSSGYWAERPIESASEQGFMSGDGSGNFRPNQPVTKVQAITALNRGLNLPDATQRAATTSTQQTTQPAKQRTARRPIFVPIAITSLMQPILSRAQAAAPQATTAPTTAQKAEPASSTKAIVNQYYTDANRIPNNAVDDVAAATKQNIVVNYPNRKVLNPNQPVSRATIAALVHQTLVNQGKIEPLPENSQANQYLVRVYGRNSNAR